MYKNHFQGEKLIKKYLHVVILKAKLQAQMLQLIFIPCLKLLLKSSKPKHQKDLSAFDRS